MSMRRPQGYAVISEPDKQDREYDVFRCAHCMRLTHVKARARPEDIGGFCSCCTGLICSGCVGKGCDPLEAKLERVERSQDMRRWLKECT